MDRQIIMAGSIHTHHRLAPLVQQVRAAAAKYDIVSFDVFDTLLIRRLHDPDLLKLATARFISNLAESNGNVIRPEKVQRLRNKVEAMHRRRAAREYPDHEASYPVFMADTLKVVFEDAANDELLRKVTDYELSIESSFLVARMQFVELLQSLKKLNKRIVVISDMYLPAGHIKILLDRAGFEGMIDDVISSADTMKAKASGAAWPLVKERLQIDPSRWLHVGDNPISDGARPAEFGVDSVVLQDIDEMHRKLLAKTYYEISRYRPYWRGRLAHQWMLPLEGENRLQSELYEHGRTFFGPMLCAYVQHIAEEAMEKGVKRVYFLAREGQILREIWNKITPVLFPGKKLPEAHYLYVSRMALAGASSAYRGVDYESIRITFLPAQNRDFRDVCRVFNWKPEPFVPVLARNGMNLETVLSRWHDGYVPTNVERFQAMVEHDESFQVEAKKQGRPSNDALMKYLESEKFFDDDKISVVDIGWLGTIQRFLYNATEHREDQPAFYGNLLVCAAGYPFPYKEDNQLTGFYHDHKRFDFIGSLILYVQDLFEETTRANHPGVTGYALDESGNPKPMFRANDDGCARNEQVQSEYFEDVQKGILDCAEYYAPAMAVLGYRAREWKSWLNVQTVNTIVFPRTRDVDILTRIHHLDDFAGGREVNRRAKKSLTKLWTRPLWQLRLFFWVRPYYFIKYAVHWLRS